MDYNQQLVTHPSQVLEAIETLQLELEASQELVGRLSQAHAFYMTENACGETIFGFSKFVGYVGLNAETYLATASQRSGSKSEVALSLFFNEISANSSLYRHYYGKLSEFLAKYGKTPRKGVRLMVMKPEFQEDDAERIEDRRLLDLIVAVADLLSPHQLQELRDRL